MYNFSDMSMFSVFSAFPKRAYITAKSPIAHQKKSAFTSEPDAFISSAKKDEPEISFTGLSRTLGKKLFFSREDIADLAGKYSKSSGKVGNMPADWIEHIPAEKRSQCIKDFYSSMGIISFKLRNYAYNKDPMLFEEANTMFNNSLKRNYMTSSDTNIQEIGRGLYGTAYKFNINGHDYVLKVFHNLRDGMFWHGNYVEPARAIFINKNNKKHQYPKFYAADTYNGYMITDFISSETKEPSKSINIENMGLYNPDAQKTNLINGHVIDYGGHELIDTGLAINKTARWVVKNFYKSKNLCEYWDKIYKSKNHDRDGVLYGLACLLDKLPQSEAVNRYNLLMNNEKLRSKLVCCLDVIPASERYDYLLKLTENSDDSVKQIISYFPQNNDLIMPSDLKLPHKNFHIKSLDGDTDDIKLILKRLLAYNLHNVENSKIFETIGMVMEGFDYKAREILEVTNFEDVALRGFKAIDAEAAQKSFEENRARVKAIKNLAAWMINSDATEIS